MEPASQNLDPDFQTDTRAIRKDLKKVIITNVAFVVLLLGLYFINQKLGFLSKLENLF